MMEVTFYDREQETKEIMDTLRMKPRLITYIYGPINSGKTELIIATDFLLQCCQKLAIKCGKGGVKENILFVDPVNCIIKPQSQLNLLAIREVMRKHFTKV